jgi:oligopeptide/dipeptide ABC transporter ATP-binding protein
VIAASPSTLLSIKDLQVSLPSRGGLLRVVDGVDLEVAVGKVSGIAGESGSGKTISMMAILGLLPAGAAVAGEARFRGYDLLSTSDGELAKRRGKDVGLVMQDPHSSLHPMLSVGQQLTDHVRHHLKLSRRAAHERAIDLLQQVRIPDPRGSFDAYPHQFSGGMCQRISIAIALACGPSLLIADEPTTGLDVTVQAGILHLLHDLGEQHRLAIILITHDLGVMSTLADTITIMYAGRVVEAGPTESVLGAPRHPYTAALLGALPNPDRPDAELRPIPGHLGPPDRWPSGCAFHRRCTHAEGRCSETVPDLVEGGRGRVHACMVDPFRPVS